ncbi:MAG: tandem-95 repeat protein, partial [Actinomycetota bacterium]
TYTPTANYNGPDSFTFRASDANSDSNTATYSITVTPVNDAPSATDDSSSTDEDTSKTINVTGNDTDVDADTLVASGSGSTTQSGTFSCSTNSCTYTPPANFNGSDSFDYTVSDGTATDTATVTIAVAAVDDSPNCSNASGSIPEEFALNDTLACSDSDTAASALTYSKVAGPSNGTVTVNSDGTFTYTPTANYNGPDSFTFRASDANSDSNTATYSITVTPVNDAPSATDDSSSTDEDTSKTINVTANDADVDGDTLVASGSGSTTEGGTFSCSTNSCTYTPPANFNGPDSFDYTVSDGTATDTATVTVAVAAVNDAPTAATDTLTTNEDTANSVNVLANDNPGPGEGSQSLSVTADSDGLKGTVTCTSTGSCTYTPNANATGTDQFSYDVCDDGAPSRCSTGTVNVSITAVNDAPTCADDSAASPEDTSLGDTLVCTDADGDPLTYSKVADPSNGTVTVNSDGTFTYIPNANYNGPENFTFKANDGTSDSNTATYSITVTPVGEPSVGDVQPPQAEDGGADRELFSPNGDGRFDEVNFFVGLSEHSTWNLTVESQQVGAPTLAWLEESTLLFRHSGEGSQVALTWDGRATDGSPAPEGEYRWEISATDSAGNTAIVMTGHIQIDTTAPLFTRQRAVPNPLDLSRDDVAAIRFAVNEAGAARAKIFRRGRLIKAFPRFRLRDAARVEVLWDGTDRAGRSVRPGRYTVVMRASDLVANRTVNRGLRIRVR